MTILRVRNDCFEPIPATDFSTEELRERADLQRLLRNNVQVLDSEIMVIAEEFSEWEDSRRRIDLLALDRDANLVVIELKRDDSAHMELQAIRYASMISTMTFDHLVRVHGEYLAPYGGGSDARERILRFLGCEEEEGDQALGDVRIILVSSEFSRELTTAVLWLNERGLDIRCMRLKPYRVDDQLLVDAQQIIPLAEAQDYMIRMREKRREERRSGRESTMEEFWRELRPEFHDVARALLDWVEPRVSWFWPGRGSCVPILEVAGFKHHAFRMSTAGEVEIYFNWMSRKPPFSDRALRLEFMTRLNRIDGADLPIEKLEHRPRISLRLLEKPEAMARFQEALDWWFRPNQGRITTRARLCICMAGSARYPARHTDSPRAGVVDLGSIAREVAARRRSRGLDHPGASPQVRLVAISQVSARRRGTAGASASYRD